MGNKIYIADPNIPSLAELQKIVEMVNDGLPTRRLVKLAYALHRSFLESEIKKSLPIIVQRGLFTGLKLYPEPFGFERDDWPNIDRWLENISTIPGWQHPYDLMPGNPSERA